MAGNIGDGISSIQPMFHDVHQITADFSACDGSSKDLKSIDLAFEAGDQRLVNLTRKLDLGLDAEVSIALTANEEDKQHVSERYSEVCGGTEHRHLLLKVCSVLRLRMIDVAQNQERARMKQTPQWHPAKSP